MAENIKLFLEVLPKAGSGWLGIFVVTIIIIFTIWVLDRVTEKRN